MDNATHGPNLQCRVNFNGADHFRHCRLSTQKSNNNGLARFDFTTA